MAFTRTQTGYRLVPTNRGDNLQRIAARELGDAARWVELVRLNRLQPPYLVDDPTLAGPAVIVTGQDIKLPAPAPVPTAIADPNTVFGTDIQLYRPPGLKCGRIRANAAGDWATVSGLENLKQALNHALMTEQGDLIRYPRYGSRHMTLIGQGNSPVIDMLAAAYVSAAVRADPRIARVEQVTASVAGDVDTVTLDAVTAAGKRVPIALVGGVPQ